MKKNKAVKPKNITIAQDKDSSKRELYVEELISKLKKWDRELAGFEKTNEVRLSDAKQKLNQNLTFLKTKRDQLSKKMDQIERLGKKNFNEIKRDLDKLWKNLKKGITNIKKETEKTGRK